MGTQRVARNATFAVFQVVVTSVTLFLLYAIVVKRLGFESMGIWSVVTALASVSRLGELGVTGTVVKFVAKYSGNSPDQAQRVVQTAALSGSVMVGLFAVAGSVVFPAVLTFFVPEEGIGNALWILPWSLLSAWLLVTANILLAALDGNQRIDIRAILHMVAGVLLLIGTVLLVDKFQLLGLVYAQILQSTFLLLAAWLFLRRTMPKLPVIPYHWDRNTFRLMFGYGISFQAITVMQMLYEPTTKLLVSYYGGLSTTGYYEMASRMVLQFRGLFAAGTQVTVPLVANVQENAIQRAETIYRDSYAIVFFLAAPLFCLFMAITPFISKLWLGNFELVFVQSSVLLAIAWWINSLVGPAYFHYLGTGRLRWNVLGHFVIGIVNLGLAYVLGEFLGGIGPILAWSIALSLGSMLIQYAYLAENRLELITLMPEASRLLLAVSITLSMLSFVVYDHLLFETSAISALAATVAVFALLVFPLMWKHPVASQLLGLVSKRNRSTPGNPGKGQ